MPYPMAMVFTRGAGRLPSILSSAFGVWESGICAPEACRSRCDQSINSHPVQAVAASWLDEIFV